jgi:hypothetical protein
MWCDEGDEIARDIAGDTIGFGEVMIHRRGKLTRGTRIPAASHRGAADVHDASALCAQPYA